MHTLRNECTGFESPHCEGGREGGGGGGEKIQFQAKNFEEDPEVENEAASKEADGNEPIEHAAASIDNANAAASIENEGKYIM